MLITFADSSDESIKISGYATDDNNVESDTDTSFDNEESDDSELYQNQLAHPKVYDAYLKMFESSG